MIIEKATNPMLQSKGTMLKEEVNEFTPYNLYKEKNATDIEGNPVVIRELVEVTTLSKLQKVIDEAQEKIDLIKV